MKLFKVPAGSPVHTKDEWSEYDSKNMTKVVTEEDQFFELNEMQIDPLGTHPMATGPDSLNTVGGRLARNGFYAFTRDGKTTVINGRRVTVMQ